MYHAIFVAIVNFQKLDSFKICYFLDSPIRKIQGGEASLQITIVFRFGDAFGLRTLCFTEVFASVMVPPGHLEWKNAYIWLLLSIL